MSRGTTGPAALDDLAELEEERKFLLRSIADLERERAAGDVDDHDYNALRDGYTARAAVVLRAIEHGRAALPPKQPRNWRRTTVIIAVVIAVAAVAGILVAYSSGQRTGGDTITGGTSPNQVATLLSEARQLLGTDPGAASTRYLAVLDIEPDNIEALTYAGWLVGLSARNADGTTNPATLSAAKKFLNAAIAIDSSYPDPYCFLAILSSNLEGDDTAARSFVDQCLANDPPGEVRGLVEEFAKTLDPATLETSGPPPSTGPGTTTD